ncbi:MAG: putative hydroxypyruvate reductase [Alphaproteobacteria bacterium MarineAlpha9_Bin3]|nr:MAG: putative hydroxypyruvate reductase [Alphaproteobacteria bacterium MarineAlpha9_Bin3]|tara:strand:- start:3272 stop:4561 length:1290 start_codon:yes stop_codon:yes gene_type:complete
MKNNHYKKILLKMFDEAISISHPKNLMKKYIPNKQPSGKTVVIGAGKASAEMAREFEISWINKGYKKLEGIVITRYGHKRKCKNIKILEAAHPVPDKAGLSATNDIINLIKPLTSKDLVIVLISGGGSSLLVSPLGKVSLKEKQNLTNQLLRCGATISEINSVRKHLSRVKGGKLASFAYPAKVITLAISDVPGDDFSTIASGPTYPDHTSNKDAIEVLSKYNISISKNIENILRSDTCETPKETDKIFDNAKFNIIAKPQNALIKASKVAKIKKFNTLILSDSIEGESNDVGLMHSAIVKQVLRFGQPAKTPLCILSGGETTVTIKKDNGKGGRNTQFLLSLVIALGATNNVYAIACDTDGIDGSEDNAGAIMYPNTLQRAYDKGLNPKEYLERNDAYSFFKILGDIIKTGPTHTNVNDFRAILIPDN